MRVLALSFVLVLAGCAPAPKPAEQARPDATAEAWYPQTVGELNALNLEAQKLARAGKFDAAAEIVTQAQPLETRLLSVPRPTLEATVAASDLDDLYGRLLLRNRHYDWAASILQKNVIRWKAWKPQTEDTARRLQAAVAALAECEHRRATP